jgi:hypothetical protein
MTGTHDESSRLQEAWHDVCYALFRATGIIWLAESIGLQPKDWVAQRRRSVDE